MGTERVDLGITITDTIESLVICRWFLQLEWCPGNI